jgi:CspA family cold shock protein
MVVAPRALVVLKWFDPVRGFGFVKSADGGPDALLPAAVVEAAGNPALPDGSTLEVEVIEGRKGPQVSQIHTVDTTRARPTERRAERRPERGAERGAERDADKRPRRPEPPRAVEGGPPGGTITEDVLGTVKSYDTERGFGFVRRDDGERDVFVHARTLERTGIIVVEMGQRVRMTVRQGDKGPDATVVTLEA